MTRTFKIEIPGEPVRKKRAQHRIVKNKDNTVRFLQTYSDQSKVEAAIKKEIHAQMKGRPRLTGYLEVFFVFAMTRPQIHWRTGAGAGTLKDKFKQAMPEKKDLDNLEKFYADACNGILYEDDCRIVASHAYKFYEDETTRASTQIWVRELPFENTDAILRYELQRHFNVYSREENDEQTI